MAEGQQRHLRIMDKTWLLIARCFHSTRFNCVEIFFHFNGMFGY